MSCTIDQLIAAISKANSEEEFKRMMGNAATEVNGFIRVKVSEAPTHQAAPVQTTTQKAQPDNIVADAADTTDEKIAQLRRKYLQSAKKQFNNAVKEVKDTVQHNGESDQSEIIAALYQADANKQKELEDAQYQASMYKSKLDEKDQVIALLRRKSDIKDDTIAVWTAETDRLRKVVKVLEATHVQDEEEKEKLSKLLNKANADMCKHAAQSQASQTRSTAYIVASSGLTQPVKVEVKQPAKVAASTPCCVATASACAVASKPNQAKPTPTDAEIAEYNGFKDLVALLKKISEEKRV